MTDVSTPTQPAPSPAHDAVLELKARIGRAVLGQDRLIESMLIGLLANGNLLLESLPGLAKTRAVKTLAKHAQNGIACVRASRVAIGRVGRNVELDDDKLGFVAALDHNPQKARVLLRLALLKSKSPAELQRLFDEY